MVIFQPDRYLLKKQISELSGHIKGRVLDVGAGSPLRYKKLFNFSEYLTLDLDEAGSPDAIGSATDMPFEKESFDSLISTQVLGDIFEIEKAFSEFARVLKPGGYLLFSESLLNELHDEPHDYWRFTPFSIKELLKRSGFELVELKQRGGFWSSAQQNFIRYLIESLGLYKKRKWLGGIFKLSSQFFGRLAILLDRLDRGKGSKKFAIGWTVLAKKIY